MGRSLDEAVAFEAAQGLGEHLLGDAVYLSVQVVVAASASGERVDHQHGPLIRHEAEDPPEAVLSWGGGTFGVWSLAHHEVRIPLSGAFL